MCMVQNPIPEGHDYVAPVAPPRQVCWCGHLADGSGMLAMADVPVGVEMVTQGIWFSNTHNPTRTNVFFLENRGRCKGLFV